MAEKFDVVVIGGGHAGIEAAAAAVRMGAAVAMVTLNPRGLGAMPCNPAVGGVGKGHLVTEIDALGGLQGWAADRAGVQFRVLNRSRGPAVWGPRAQCDKGRYVEIMTRVVGRLLKGCVFEGEVKRVATRRGRVVGVVLADGKEIAARTVVVTTGTFMGGVLHTGPKRWEGGRYGEGPSVGLGRDLQSLGLKLRRYKTGTPPRVDRLSIDFSRLQEQPGDAEPRGFSWRTKEVANKTACWLARTPEVVQDIIRDNLDRSPLFGGAIEGVGPRYCPSIEDKVVRFPHHKTHTVFVEPETLLGRSMYLNGVATSLPGDVQDAIVRRIPGFAGAKILRYGYAVEYDVVNSRQVRRNLSTGAAEGLYLAGQVLGTSGYEEAAAQGLVAGINAAAEVLGCEGFRPERRSSYLGVLIEDLVHREHREPYRMLTSRAEHRLMLGVDSARERLMADGVRLGLVREHTFHVERRRWENQKRLQAQLEGERVTPTRVNREWAARVLGIDLQRTTTVAGLLRRQDVSVQAMRETRAEWMELSNDAWDAVVGKIRYHGYLDRQKREVARVARLRNVQIPEGFPYRAVSGLSREVVEEMERVRPQTLAEAEGLAGVTPSAVALLAGQLARGRTGGEQ